MTPVGAYRNAHAAQGPFFYPKDAIRHNSDILGAWTSFVLDRSEGFTQAGVESVNDSIRNYVWECKPRRGRIFSRPGRDMMPRNNSWQISKSRLPRLLTSQAASLGIKYAPVCVHALGLRLRNRAQSDAERHGASPG